MNILFTLITILINLQDPVRVNDSSPLPWFKGATPPIPKNTVLVFVHGKHDDEKIWFEDVNHYGHNRMYELAYERGYRTAFVRLGDESSMWYNGRVLAQQLENIERYYDTRNIIIIAHSKGGIDAQSALVYYNAIGAGRKIISLSTPYYGSPLADLAFSNIYTTWLSLIIGQATPATFVLQTAYMHRFQERISQDMDNQYVYYYTLSGWDHGPFPLWLGGIYLTFHGGENERGGNDGAVTFQSAHVSFQNGLTHRVSLGAHEDSAREWYLNHSNIALGQNTWQYIDSLIQLHPAKTHLYAQNVSYSTQKTITIKTTGYIKSGEGTYEYTINPNTNLFIVKPTKSQVYLNKGSLDFKKLEPEHDIEYATFTTQSKQQIQINGKFFLIGDEGNSPLYVTYNPITKNSIPNLILKTENSYEKIQYTLFIKEYKLSGTFVKDIKIHGETQSETPVLLPLYNDALYNIHLKANYNNRERDVVFTIIKESDYQKSYSLTQHQNLSEIARGEDQITNEIPLIDILGRRVKTNKSGIFFIRNRERKKAIVIIK